MEFIHNAKHMIYLRCIFLFVKLVCLLHTHQQTVCLCPISAGQRDKMIITLLNFCWQLMCQGAKA